MSRLRICRDEIRKSKVAYSNGLELSLTFLSLPLHASSGTLPSPAITLQGKIIVGSSCLLIQTDPIFFGTYHDETQVGLSFRIN